MVAHAARENQQEVHREWREGRHLRALEPHEQGWQAQRAQQAFPICPTPEDPDACNVYKELDLPEEIFRHNEEYREQQFVTGDAAR